MQSTGSGDWAYLPDEVLLHLFGFISDVRELCQVSCVCKSWNLIGNDVTLWSALALKLDAHHSHSAETDQPPLSVVDLKQSIQAALRVRNSFGDDFNALGPRTKAFALKGLFPGVPSTRKYVPPNKDVIANPSDGCDTIKIAVVGPGGIGKTSACRRFTDGEWYDEYVPSILDIQPVFVQVGGQKKYAVEFWDTANSKDYNRIRNKAYPGASVVLVAFSLTSSEAINQIESFITELAEESPGTPILLAGTKLDLLDDDDALQKASWHETVSPTTPEEVEKLVKMTGAVGCIPFSSLKNWNVDLLFKTMIDIALSNDHRVSPITRFSSVVNKEEETLPENTPQEDRPKERCVIA